MYRHTRAHHTCPDMYLIASCDSNPPVYRPLESKALLSWLTAVQNYCHHSVAHWHRDMLCKSSTRRMRMQGLLIPSDTQR